ncbi:MAG: 1,5-anhydro-D-fructose reductase (1,5-anhydro-D-mannitol-forming) [Glaciecola sp.]|jgi:1,5-anhydro-D-fructose reductase (1,5-anhydro-D-mannitol-forming)
MSDTASDALPPIGGGLVPHLRYDAPMTTSIAVIGLGLMGQRMLSALGGQREFDCRLVWDLDPEATRKMSTQFGIPAAGSWREILENEVIEALYIATPPASHGEYTRAALAAGKPVFVEKPLTVDLQDGEDLVRAAEESDLPVVVNFPFATLPGLERIQREITSGEAGAVLRADIQLHFSQWPRTWHNAGPWLSGPKEGGFLREVFSHFAYLTQRLLGPLELQSGSLGRTAQGTEEWAAAQFLAGSTPVFLSGGAGGAAPDFNRWTLYCENKSYRVEDWSMVQISDGAEWSDLMPEPGESHGLDKQLSEWSKALRGEPHALATAIDGCQVMRCVEALLNV